MYSYILFTVPTEENLFLSTNNPVVNSVKVKGFLNIASIMFNLVFINDSLDKVFDNPLVLIANTEEIAPVTKDIKRFTSPILIPLR